MAEQYTLQYTGNQVEDRLARVGTLEERVNDIQNSQIPSLQSSISGLRTDVGQYNNRFSTLESELGNAQKRIGTLETNATNANKNIETLTSDIGTINSTLANKVNYSEYNSQIDILKATDSNNYNILDQHISNINQALDGGIKANTSDIADNRNNIAELSEKIKTINTDMGSLPTRVDRLEESWTSYEAKILQLDTDSKDNKTSIDALGNSLTDFKSEVSGNYATIAVLTNYVLQSNYNNFINSYNSYVSSLESTIEDMQATITQLQNRIIALEQNKGES